jgi:ribosomal protein S18 acetylase RimI-like enzyme
MPTDHPLDHPALAALTGPHARFAQRRGRVLRYEPDVSPWLALPHDPGPEDWADVQALAGRSGTVGLPGFEGDVPDTWRVVFRAGGVQMVADGLRAGPDPEAVVLGPADVPEMLGLVERTKPGPFLPRTIELGTYLGVRRGGRLVAMAGERMRTPGWTEISAVCTDPEFRGQGLAGRLVSAVAAGIEERGETPFLHAAAANAEAVRLYENLGFAIRRKLTFLAAEMPGEAPGGTE